MLNVEVSPAHRGHVVDDVFGQLSAAILRGELAPEQPLPPERVLAARFAISRVMVRQAVHRLAEHGLVRVRQGGATIVCDPDSSNDPRVTAMLYRSAPEISARLTEDMIEKQCMQGLALVDVAARRGSKQALARLVAFVDDAAGSPARLARFAEFEAAFWSSVAAAGGNRIFAKEVAWWQQAVGARPLPVDDARAPSQRIAFHHELARRLLEDDDAVVYYQHSVRPLLDSIFKPKKRRR